MPSSLARKQGIDAAEAVVRKFGWEHVGESRDEVDFIASNGTGYSAKSAAHTKANGRPGVFRFNKEHLESMKRETPQSGVVLLLMPSVGASSSTPLKIETVPTQRVFEIINDRWYPQTREYEIPWPKLLSY